MSASVNQTLTEETGRHVKVTAQPIKVLVVDDHPGVRAGLKNLIEGAQDIVVLGEGVNGAEALQLIDTQPGDLLLLDIELPDQRGDRVMRRIHELHPELKVLAVSSYTDREYILGMVENGAAGYITKDEAPLLLVQAIRIIVRERKDWFSPRALQNSSSPALDEQTLTERELQILQHLLREQDPAQMAAALQMPEPQLQKHLTLLMRKFETDSLDVLKLAAQRIVARR